METPHIDTSRQMPPRLDFLRRFIVMPITNELEEVERETTGPLMTPLINRIWFQPRALSPIAKMTENDEPAQAYGETLPEPDVVRAMLQQHQLQQPNATADANSFPFKLKAIGRVNAMAIFERGGQPEGPVSNVVSVVP